MDWMQFSTFLITNTIFTLTLWLWNRAETRSDHKDLEQWTKMMLKSIEKQSLDFHTAMMNEQREFHGRLCAIEERTRK